MVYSAFANFAEALAEGRSKASSSLRSWETNSYPKTKSQYGSSWELVSATQLRKGMTVLVETGDIIPVDGEVIEGVLRSMSATQNLRLLSVNQVVIFLL